MSSLIESEEDTKQRKITPAIQKAGWDSKHYIMEYSLRADRFKIVPGKNYTEKVKQSKRDRPDYLLCKTVNFPIAVLEAKSSDKYDSEGIDQAKKYAEILDLPFAYSSSGHKFIEHDFTTGEQRELGMDEFPTPDELWKRWCDARKIKSDESLKQLESALYYTSDDGKTPRYYQMLAINKTVNAVLADNKKRVLLVMATGTGKTYTAFQIIWRLLKGAKRIKNVLYLADRNILVDQTIIGDFQPFEKICTKIEKRKIDTSYQIYFGLYQQLKGGDDKEGTPDLDTYKQLNKDFFDLIIVDECHRGSARIDSSWRDILEYFDSAIQIGLTATPNTKIGSNNVAYFGDPIYTYSLKQGIDDGFLAPYQLIHVALDKDLSGWEPEEGETDDNGLEIPQRKYTIEDFDTKIILRDRTRTVAKVITQTLQRIGNMSKTIVFCTTQRHALELRDELRKLNEDMMKVNHDYIVRMTSDDEDGRALLDDFTSVQQKYPVVVTTSKLLTTGADTKCVKLIVLDAPIKSMTEFKQIIGRGTRLREDVGKTFFTILDFRGVSNLFKDKDFDGDPDWVSEWKEDTKTPSTDDGKKDNGGGKKPKKQVQAKDPTKPKAPSNPRQLYEVSYGQEFCVVAEDHKLLDENGKLVTDRLIDYTRQNIIKEYSSESDFLEVWNGEKEKQRIIESLADKGIFIDALRKEMGNEDYDEFDLIVSIAFGATPFTRQQRSSRVKQSKFLEKYQGVARQVLDKLLDVYAHIGISEITDPNVLKSKQFESLGSPLKIIREFGGIDAYEDAIRSMEQELYMPQLNGYNSAVDSSLGL